MRPWQRLLALRVLDRRDAPLAIGLIVGALVMFAQPLRFLLSVAEDVSRTYHVDLIPGLMLFVLVFTIHHRQKHRDAQTAVQVAAREAEEARRVATHMERLVAASHAMSNALDAANLRVQAWRHVPPLVGDRAVWVAVLMSGEWQWLIEPSAGGDATLELAPTLLQLALAAERRHNGLVLFPMSSSGRPLGVMAVQEDHPLTPVEESRIAALAMIISIALKNVHLFEQMQMTSVSDALTGCFNRAHAFATLDSELRRARRTRRPLSVIMFDIDGFKAINDEHGHLCGDQLLQAIGQTLCRTLRTSDVKCRYGGDEFLVVLPDTPPEGAEQVAEHLRRAIERLEVAGRTKSVACRVSLGIASANPNETDASALVTRADEALYQMKRRNVQKLRLVDSASVS